MNENRGDQVVELDADSWISVEIDRQWPKYVATWSIRRRIGDSDYPVRSGTVERIPPSDPTELDDMIEKLRQEAVDQATAEVASTGQEEGRKEGASWIDYSVGAERHACARRRRTRRQNVVNRSDRSVITLDAIEDSCAVQLRRFYLVTRVGKSHSGYSRATGALLADAHAGLPRIGGKNGCFGMTPVWNDPATML